MADEKHLGVFAMTLRDGVVDCAAPTPDQLRAVIAALSPDERAEVCGHGDCEDVHDNLQEKLMTAEARAEQAEQARDAHFGNLLKLTKASETLAAKCEQAERERDELRERVIVLEAGLGCPKLEYQPNGQTGDGQNVCSCCGEAMVRPHTWERCAHTLLDAYLRMTDNALAIEREHDALRAKCERLEAELAENNDVIDQITQIMYGIDFHWSGQPADVRALATAYTKQRDRNQALEAELRRAIKVVAASAPQPEKPPEPAAEVADALCADCNQVYGVRDGYEDTGICDPCAQSRVVGEQPAGRAGPDVGTLEAIANCLLESAELAKTWMGRDALLAAAHAFKQELTDIANKQGRYAAKEPR